MKKTVIFFLLIFCTSSAFTQTNVISQQDSSRPFVLGEIDVLQSTILNEKRTLNIYLPEGYNASDSTRYPVIYLLDGSANEDFIHIAGLVQFESFEWIHELPKSIVVGIATVDRRRDFTFPTTISEDKKLYPTTGHSDKFINFLERELQPFINRKFKTASVKTIIGESLGGLLATEILIERPALFNKYIIVSPSLWWNNGSLLSQRFDKLNDSSMQQTDIYIGVGKEGLTPTAIPRVMEVDANVLADKIRAVKSKSVNVLFDYLSQENHATIMHQAVLNAFRQMSNIKSNKD